ncbi:MAG: hypothetical protein K9K30_00920 [Burkholderiaceae bacterium]|nr:hypothetical protein [Sulfuritalea sp.]MCF8173790.1 hypothetical protein [Burkholderiaceae bacterium]MCF8184194.1 hypothetical protein [Polynucleobacter sp.]
MKRPVRLVLLLLGLAGFAATAPAATEANQDNCRKAVEEGLNALRHPAPGSRARDEERRKELLAMMERLVESSRQQGKSECETWGQMMRKAFTQ